MNDVSRESKGRDVDDSERDESCAQDPMSDENEWVLDHESAHDEDTRGEKFDHR
jgi:hypothetical protein